MAWEERMHTIGKNGERKIKTKIANPSQLYHCRILLSEIKFTWLLKSALAQQQQLVHFLVPWVNTVYFV